jgi:predicted RecB family endonuclease
MLIDKLITEIVECPSEDNKNEYEDAVNCLEYNLAMQGEKVKAFSVRRDYAIQMLKQWVAKYKTTEGCPVSYADTLNIPFRTIKKPKSLE